MTNSLKGEAGFDVALEITLLGELPREMAAPAMGQPSNRVDVEANSKLPPFLIPQAGKEYFDINDWNFATVEEPPLRARMKGLLGG